MELVLFLTDLFRLISDENGHADQHHIHQLLSAFMQIPCYLGEVAAFGGTDVDPSVYSCFQFVRVAGSFWKMKIATNFVFLASTTNLVFLTSLMT